MLCFNCSKDFLPLLCQECAGSSTFSFCLPLLFFKLYFSKLFACVFAYFSVLLIFIFLPVLCQECAHPARGGHPSHSPRPEGRSCYSNFILLLYIFYIIMYHVSSYMATHPTLSDLKTKKYHILIYFISYIIVNHISSYMGWSPTSFSPT